MRWRLSNSDISKSLFGLGTLGVFEGIVGVLAFTDNTISVALKISELVTGIAAAWLGVKLRASKEFPFSKAMFYLRFYIALCTLEALMHALFNSRLAIAAVVVHIGIILYAGLVYSSLQALPADKSKSQAI